MPTRLNRITFAVPTGMEQRLDNLKQRVFYRNSQSDMIRALIEAGFERLYNVEPISEQSATDSMRTA